MRKFLLTLLVIALNLCALPMAFGDNVPTRGEWGRGHRTIIPSPPILFIEGNVLSVQFVDMLEDLTVQVQDIAGAIVYEEVIAGNRNEVYNIVLNDLEVGVYHVIIEHKTGWMVGDFQI